MSAKSRGPDKPSGRPSSEGHHQGPDGLRRALMVIACLLVVNMAVIATHCPVIEARALSFDDGDYLTNNALVQRPSWESVRRFVTEVRNPSTVAGYYQPLSMISLMLDAAAGGRPEDLRAFHATSLLLHVLNVTLLMLLLHALFGNLWAAAIVALLFGVHPLTVEPIAWVGERKTVLATCFALASLLAYVGFVRRRSGRLYGTSLAMFLLALLSKPTTTPLPLLLMLLDIWPLNRVRSRTVSQGAGHAPARGVSLWVDLRGLFLEKAPFFLMAALFAGITLVSQGGTAELRPTREGSSFELPLVLAHNNIFYLYKIAWPRLLSSIYPFPSPLSPASPAILVGLIGSGLLLASIALSLRWTRAWAVGFTFFFVAILPTQMTFAYSLGIAHDKYAYFPMCGLLLTLTALLARCGTGVSPVRSPARRRRHILIIACIVPSAVLFALQTRRQIQVWADRGTLQRHILSVAPEAVEVRVELGVWLKNEGKLDEAAEQAHRIIASAPNDHRGYQLLADLVSRRDRLDEAMSLYETSLSLAPPRKKHEVCNNLGIVVARKGDLKRAMSLFQQAIELSADYPDACNNLGNCYMTLRQFDEAIVWYQRALEIKPRYTDALNNLGDALLNKGQVEEAIQKYDEVLRIDPKHESTRRSLERAQRLKQAR